MNIIIALLVRLIEKTAYVGSGYASSWGMYQTVEPKELTENNI
jgi:cyclic lactone autoinducer peptide